MPRLVILAASFSRFAAVAALALLVSGAAQATETVSAKQEVPGKAASGAAPEKNAALKGDAASTAKQAKTEEHTHEAAGGTHGGTGHGNDAKNAHHTEAGPHKPHTIDDSKPRSYGDVGVGSQGGTLFRSPIQGGSYANGNRPNKGGTGTGLPNGLGGYGTTTGSVMGTGTGSGAPSGSVLDARR